MKQKRFHTSWGILAAWSIANVALIFSPYPYGYRLLIALQLPISIFVTIGILAVRRILSGQAMLSHAVTTFLFLIIIGDVPLHIIANFRPTIDEKPIRYVTRSITDATEWIRNNTPNDAILLSSPTMDTLLAQQTYRHVYVTHGWQTVDIIQKIHSANAIYSGQYSAERLHAFLQQQHITHVVVGPFETRRFGTRVPTSAQYPFLHVVYAAEGFTLYATDGNAT